MSNKEFRMMKSDLPVPRPSTILVRYSIFGLAALLLACCFPGLSRSAEPQRPNVVLILGDDIAWTDYGFMGHPHIETPSLDTLARESLVFRRGYVPTALCRPSLATIITGLYAHEHGITGNDPAIPEELRGGRHQRHPDYLALREELVARIDRVPTLPRVLAQHGYASLQTGKWWEGSYERGGFTHGMTHGKPHRGGRHGDEGLAIGRSGLEAVRKFLDNDRGGRPFFLWYAPFLPHTPHNPPERLLAKYQRDDRPIELARYYAMCEWFDETCGELLGLLDERALRENTIVIYVADNGWIQRTPQTEMPVKWHQAFAPRSKQSPNEGGVRTPILFRWPGRIEPQESAMLASSIDLAPTILAACGVQAPADLPGIDLIAAVAGEGTARSTLFGEAFAHDIADLNDPAASLLFRWCIDGRWKLIVPHEGRVGRYAAVHRLHQQRGIQLYDLDEDPHEADNLAVRHPERVDRLTEVLDSWWKP
jgi:arylsulfatase A-like enzyme